MLKMFRNKKIMKIVLWIIVVVIVIGFGILGNAYLISDQPKEVKHAGEIFGRKVAVKDFERNYHFSLIQAQLQYGENFEQVYPMLNLQGQTWERLVLLEQAKKEKIAVTDTEIAEMIRQYPFFRNQQTNRFDKKIYQMVLRNGLKMTARDFEQGVRDDLKIRKLFDRQTFTTTVNDNEILEAYKELNEKVRVSYALFPAENFIQDVTFDEVEAKNFFLAHKRNFVQPPTINISYLRFSFDEDEQSKNKAYDNAFQALSLLQNNQTFKEIASQFQMNIQETGFMDIQNPDLSLGWPAEIFQKMTGMKAGEFTNIETTDSSYDILQLSGSKSAFIPGYDQVKEKVRQAWIKAKAIELSKLKAEHIHALLNQENFKSLIEGQGLTVVQTPEFNRGEYLPNIGTAPAFQQAAFSLAIDNPVSVPVETEKGYAILYLDERFPADMEKYKEEKQAFSERILLNKKMNSFSQYVSKLKEKAQVQDFISEYLKQ